MHPNSEDGRHLKFYGLNDLSTSVHAGHAAHLLENYYDPTRTTYTLTEILELYNALLFIENSAFPGSYDDAQRSTLRALTPRVRATIGRFFNALDEAALEAIDEVLESDYHLDLLKLFERYKVYERCTPLTLLRLLDRLGFLLGEMLASNSLVRFCDGELRMRLLADSVNAEHLIREHLAQQDGDQQVYLPSSFTQDDALWLLDKYLDRDDANPNSVELVSLSRVNPKTGVSSKTKLKAKRKHEQWVKEFFNSNSGMKTSCEVLITDDQVEPVEVSSIGLSTRFSYGRRWLEENLDYPTILNNFIYIFDYVDHRGLLTLPSLPAELGPIEQAITVSGKDAYAVGSAFRFKDQLSTLQMITYFSFLRANGIELESVLAWFFETYLDEQFGLEHFQYVPSSKTSTYLEKSRHLFSEMESVARQYSLYVENGELDTGLLEISSEQVRYRELPSLVSSKYLYPAENSSISTILNLLFSDQSLLGYISESQSASSAAALLNQGTVAYGDFHDFQKPGIDYLIEQGVLVNLGVRLKVANTDQLIVLKDLFHYGVAHHYHYSPESRRAINEMIEAGWLLSESALLCHPEASYFNYFLNQLEFSNGPDLRNKYLHGSHLDSKDEDQHFRTYLNALKLLVALVVKINDDLCVREAADQPDMTTTCVPERVE